MSYRIVRTDKEIDDCLNDAAESDSGGSKWPGMTYEQGVCAAIEWMIEQNEHHPMED